MVSGDICFGVLKLQQLDGHLCVFFIAWSQGLIVAQARFEYPDHLWLPPGITGAHY